MNQVHCNRIYLSNRVALTISQGEDGVVVRGRLKDVGHAARFVRDRFVDNARSRSVRIWDTT